MELATREVFEMMLGCQLAAPETRRGRTLRYNFHGGAGGKSVRHTDVLLWREGSYAHGFQDAGRDLPTEVSREVLDALGEVCNMVAGNFKNKDCRPG